MNRIFVLIEASKDSKNYYVYKENIDKLILEKVLDNQFPVNYGFIPKTHHDAQKLDAIVLSSEPLLPGALVCVRIIGSIRLEGKMTDYIILGIPINDLKNIKDINDVSQKDFKDIIGFFETFKSLRYKTSFGIKDTEKLIKKSIELYERFD